MNKNSGPSFGGRRSSRRLREDIETASASVTPRLTSHLQQHARGMGWPEEAVGHLYAEYHDGGYHPRYHPAGKDAVEAHEYGTFERRANPAMRTWALKADEYAATHHDTALHDAILGELL